MHSKPIEIRKLQSVAE